MRLTMRIHFILAMAILAELHAPLLAFPNAKQNRLAKESSPYLRQHAHNPVDWYPWGEEAFLREYDQGISCRAIGLIMGIL